jgi:metal-responsive CopG/Arc/MetJ family transcriptional regulator
MKTVQMTLDENLVKAVDSAAKKLGTTRSGFTREALRSALRKVRVKELESRHREGTSASQSSAASSATGSRNRFGTLSTYELHSNP